MALPPRIAAHRPRNNKRLRWDSAPSLLLFCGRLRFVATLWLAGVAGCGAADIEAAAADALPNNVTWPESYLTTRPQRPAGHPAAMVWRNNNYDPNRWAKGGTRKLARWPHNQDPFGSSDGTVCRATHTIAVPICPLQGEDTPDRQDISSGEPGLPMRLVLRVVDTYCQNVKNAVVTIWHASPQGGYSGSTATPHSCGGQNPNALRKLAFRGRQTTNDNGLVSFDSCFPGALTYRASIVNVQVTHENGDTLTTQLTFDEGLVGDIMASHSDYKQAHPIVLSPREDPFLQQQDLPAMRMHVAQLHTGAMLAHKTLVLPSCSTSPTEMMR